MTKGAIRKALIFDANVLIDFCSIDPAILKLISECVAQVGIALPVLGEVKALDEGKCFSLSIKLIEPELDIALAAAEKRGSLSFQDHLCLLLANSEHLICVTNDKRLRQECEKEEAECMWGLEPLLLLVENKGMTALEASEIAQAIHNVNPRYITRSVIHRFIQRLPE